VDRQDEDVVLLRVIAQLETCWQSTAHTHALASAGVYTPPSPTQHNTTPTTPTHSALTDADQRIDQLPDQSLLNTCQQAG